MLFFIQLSLLVAPISSPTLTTAPSIFGNMIKIMIGAIDFLLVVILGRLRIWIGIAHMII